MARSISASLLEILCRPILLLVIFLVIFVNMDGLPQCREFIEVLCRRPQNLLNVRPFRIRWPDRVVAIRQGGRPVEEQIDNRLSLASEAVNMTRRMIVRISDEPNASNPK
jgi:hypothetical protein